MLELNKNGKTSFAIMTAKVAAQYNLNSNSSVYIENNLGDFRRAYYKLNSERFSLTIGLDEVPFGFRIIDHSSLVEDSIGFGENRIDIGVKGSVNLSFINFYAGLYNGSTPRPFRFDNKGATAGALGFSFDPWDFVTLGSSGYYNKIDLNNSERILFSNFAELRYGKFIYRGEHILGRRAGKLIRAYYSGLTYSSDDKLTFLGSFEMLDKDRDVEKTAVYRAQLGTIYKFDPNISLELDYTHYLDSQDDYGSTDLYFRASY